MTRQELAMILLHLIEPEFGPPACGAYASHAMWTRDLPSEQVATISLDSSRVVGNPELMAQIGHSGDYFRLARQPGAIAITSYKPTSRE